MSTTSAGLLMYRMKTGISEVFLIHPGGPFFKDKDAGFWGIPKGLLDEGEDMLMAARREFFEETGFTAEGPFEALGTAEKPGKMLHAWSFEGDRDPATLVSNTCEVDWPPRSGTKIVIPEVDRGDYFSLEEARKKISKWQIPLLDAFESLS